MRLRVCSKIVSNASPVFKSMLAPRFSEGVQLQAHGSIEISLVDDDAKALKTTCQIVHHDNDALARYIPSVGELLRLSGLCDTYDF